MGIDSKTTLNLLNNVMESMNIPLSEITMVELGNQFIDDRSSNTSKKYYQNKIKSHISIDLNGLSGAIPLDLSSEIENYPVADIVTNFGTSEHVSSQYHCFKNIHNFCKKGGIFFHCVPHINNWKNHCDYWYDVEYFKKLSKENGYRILKNVKFSEGRYGNLEKNMVLCIMVKESDKFKSNEDFFKKNVHKR